LGWAAFVPAFSCHRIGTEHEKLGYNVADGRRLTYEQIAALLTRIQERFGWQPIVEEGKIIGLTQDGQSVTLEPGGQFELSGATLDTLHKTCAEVNSHLYQVLPPEGQQARPPGRGCI
jgi:glutamate--cysteine ligase